MRHLILAVSALSAIFLFACATAPTESQANAIKRACVADAAVRPVVSGILAAGIVPADQAAAVKAAQVVIDQVCANPEQSAQQNLLSVLSANVGNITALVVKYSGAVPSAAQSQ